MSDFADPLLSRLAEQGVLSPDDLDEVRATLSSDDQTLDGSQLAGELVGLNKLTPYQAETICAGDLGDLVIGNYVVLDVLGSGGMGHVYKARHREMDRVVALKVLPPERVSSKAGLRRFRQEVKAAARLVHPNIVTAFDADVSGGVPYLVMEFVEGRDLQAMLSEDGPLGFDTAMDYILQTAQGLEYAHRVGVIHRDIKPANLLLDASGAIRILDMGVAQLQRPADSDEPSGTQLTRDGAVVGTADFMAPEQARNARDADARSDIYSLGCTLYFLLTNAPLYRAGSVVDRLIAHRQRAVPSLSEWRPDAPAALNDLFQKMVAKNPTDRYQSITALIDDLRLVQEGHRPADLPATKSAPMPRAKGDNSEKAHSSPLFFLLMAVLAALLVACGLFYYDNYMPGEGTIYLDIDQPGATVTVIDNLGAAKVLRPTDERSRSLEIARGSYTLQITKPGFKTSESAIKLRPWQTKRVKVELERFVENAENTDDFLDIMSDRPDKRDGEIMPELESQ